MSAWAVWHNWWCFLYSQRYQSIKHWFLLAGKNTSRTRAFIVPSTCVTKRHHRPSVFSEMIQQSCARSLHSQWQRGASEHRLTMTRILPDTLRGLSVQNKPLECLKHRWVLPELLLLLKQEQKNGSSSCVELLSLRPQLMVPGGQHGMRSTNGTGAGAGAGAGAAPPGSVCLSVCAGLFCLHTDQGSCSHVRAAAVNTHTDSVLQQED